MLEIVWPQQILCILPVYIATHTQVFGACAGVLLSRWKCLLSAGVLAHCFVSVRAGENEGGVENLSNQIHHLTVCVFIQVYVWSSQPAFPALPSLILSCRSSRLVLPDLISASKCLNQPFVLRSCLLFSSDRQGEHFPMPPSQPFWALCRCHTATSPDLTYQMLPYLWDIS